NGVLGMVRQWQKLFYGERYSGTTLSRKTDLVRLAEAFGAKGLRLTEKNMIRSTLKEARMCGGPCLIDCQTDGSENVFPIIPPGRTCEETIFCERQEDSI
ncbi:MAG: thiamine pyrophosphate-dependent enzyme, partial [Bacillota bacterium]|nr:thiamine pyrophosphate-dependent enzyme [Bacillota bacterium]